MNASPEDFDAEEVINMIDAINAGTTYRLSVKGVNGGDAGFEFAESSFAISLPDNWVAEISDPKVARLIAGALVTWAHKCEDIDFSGPEFTAAMRLFGWAGTPLYNNPVNQSRTQWYDRSVKLMTDETIQRNMRDLAAVANRMITDRIRGPELNDVQRAIDICRYELRQRDESKRNRRRV